jgi:hypothetical protein
MPRDSHKRQYSCGVYEGREDDFYGSSSRFACKSGSQKQSAGFYATRPSKPWPSVFYLNLWSRSPLTCPMGSLEAILLCGHLRPCRICWWGVYDAHQKFSAHAAEISTVIGPFIVLTTSHEDLLSKLQLIRKHYYSNRGLLTWSSVVQSLSVRTCKTGLRSSLTKIVERFVVWLAESQKLVNKLPALAPRATFWQGFLLCKDSINLWSFVRSPITMPKEATTSRNPYDTAPTRGSPVDRHTNAGGIMSCFGWYGWTVGYCKRLPHYRHETEVLRVISKSMLALCAVCWLSKTIYITL